MNCAGGQGPVFARAQASMFEPLVVVAAIEASSHFRVWRVGASRGGRCLLEQDSQIRRRARLAKQISLHFRAGAITYYLQLLVGFNAFGHRFHAERRAEIGDGLDDRRAIPAQA